MPSVVAIVDLWLTDSVTTNNDCQRLGISIAREKPNTNSEPYFRTSPVINGYSYGGGGAQTKCGNSSLDNIRKNYAGDNIAPWKFYSL